MRSTPQFYNILGNRKRKAYLQVMNRWIKHDTETVLKTDLFEEAFQTDSILPQLNGKKKIGIDKAICILNKVKTNSQDYYCIKGDLKNIPFKNQTFNTIVSTTTLNDFPKKLMRRYLSELKKVLKNDGEMIIGIMNGHNIFNRISYFIIRNLCGKKKRTRHYKTKEIRKEFEKSGLTIKDAEYILYIPPFSRYLINYFEKSQFAKKTIINYFLDMYQTISRITFKKKLAHIIILKVKKNNTESMTN